MALPVDRPTSTAALVIATSVLTGVIGYYLGQGASIGIFSSSPSHAHKGKSIADEDDEEEDEEEDEDDIEGELATFEGNTDEVKLVLVVRTDLGMGKGMPFINYVELQIFPFNRNINFPAQDLYR
ncbi:mitochondrial peptidyl-tRNA hydrolase Pth2, putative [Trichophyton verrucosum HKI 0517]|uniref:Mitochondrial peptidyl-tRNA hydrolase Pth2, putative n=1 Tax=Trichophyton verrucosum (strain HKI 0517) TaxID=663202 RepID=D4D4U3_TRIVH|nr:mitochondrial peptidyl-tRNA hydrolase Pth2, putative [Trichophyton verrucosum HKI 0517]EFE43105.1 mitochondrial peptidyl-tRNA hydrolase Pth2, putative [Trichophyton verrucosum HKI 0517]